MAAVAQWEVVGKTKKTKGNAQPLDKKQKKLIIEKMPRIESRAPVEESPTLYGAFLGQEKKESQANKVDKIQKDKAKTGNDANKKGKKKSEQDKKDRKDKILTLEQAMEQIDTSELEGVLTLSQSSFPDNSEVWLKDLASFLNLKLEKVPESDPVFKEKPRDFPLSKLTSSCHKVLSSTLKQCSSQTLEHLFYHCVQMMLQESAKGSATYGYRIFIQLLAFQEPSIATSKLSQYLDLLKAHQNRPLRCLTILWALGQCGVKSLKSGLRVWLDIMLPALGVRSVAAYPVEYLENLFRWHKDRSSAYDTVTIREYFKVLDVIFSSSHNMQSDLKKRLQAQYPIIKTLAFGENPAVTLRNFFPSYLSRAAPETAGPLKPELLSCLVQCLSTDKQSFSTWCQMYTKHLEQSGVLLQHLNSEWSQIHSKLDRKLLRETLRSFCVTNDEIATQGRSSMPGYEQCAKEAKELLQKLNESSFPWVFLVLMLGVGVTAIVLYDIYTSPTIATSRTVRFLDNYGILAVTQQAWGRVQTFCSKALGWLRQNLPSYYSTFCDTAGPLVYNAWKQTCQFVVWTVEATRPHVEWLMIKTSHTMRIVWHWLYNLSPEFWASVWDYVRLSWDFLCYYALLVWSQLLAALASAYHWTEAKFLDGSFSLENVQRTASLGVETVQNYTSYLVGWCGRVFFTSSN